MVHTVRKSYFFFLRSIFFQKYSIFKFFSIIFGRNFIYFLNRTSWLISQKISRENDLSIPMVQTSKKNIHKKMQFPIMKCSMTENGPHRRKILFFFFRNVLKFFFYDFGKEVHFIFQSSLVFKLTKDL